MHEYIMMYVTPVCATLTAGPAVHAARKFSSARRARTAACRWDGNECTTSESQTLLYPVGWSLRIPQSEETRAPAQAALRDQFNPANF